MPHRPFSGFALLTPRWLALMSGSAHATALLRQAARQLPQSTPPAKPAPGAPQAATPAPAIRTTSTAAITSATRSTPTPAGKPIEAERAAPPRIVTRSAGATHAAGGRAPAPRPLPGQLPLAP